MSLIAELLSSLVHAVLTAKDPEDAARRAKRAIITDAANAATDAAVDAALKRMKP